MTEEPRFPISGLDSSEIVGRVVAQGGPPDSRWGVVHSSGGLVCVALGARLPVAWVPASIGPGAWAVAQVNPEGTVRVLLARLERGVRAAWVELEGGRHLRCDTVEEGVVVAQLSSEEREEALVFEDPTTGQEARIVLWDTDREERLESRCGSRAHPPSGDPVRMTGWCDDAEWSLREDEAHLELWIETGGGGTRTRLDRSVGAVTDLDLKRAGACVSGKLWSSMKDLRSCDVLYLSGVTSSQVADVRVVLETGEEQTLPMYERWFVGVFPLDVRGRRLVALDEHGEVVQQEELSGHIGHLYWERRK
jgi:hypothetical protein